MAQKHVDPVDPDSDLDPEHCKKVLQNFAFFNVRRGIVAEKVFIFFHLLTFSTFIIIFILASDQNPDPEFIPHSGSPKAKSFSFRLQFHYKGAYKRLHFIAFSKRGISGR